MSRERDDNCAVCQRPAAPAVVAAGRGSESASPLLVAATTQQQRRSQSSWCTRCSGPAPDLVAAIRRIARPPPPSHLRNNRTPSTHRPRRHLSFICWNRYRAGSRRGVSPPVHPANQPGSQHHNRPAGFKRTARHLWRPPTKGILHLPILLQLRHTHTTHCLNWYRANPQHSTYFITPLANADVHAPIPPCDSDHPARRPLSATSREP